MPEALNNNANFLITVINNDRSMIYRYNLKTK